MPKLDSYLQACIDRKGSDLHLASESPVYVRQLGRLTPITDQALSVQECEELIFEILDPTLAEKLKTDWEVDTAYTMANGERFRVNAYRQRKGWDAVLRHFSSRVSSIDELGLPAILKKFADVNQGLILITGPGRSGKSTTCAALVDYLNSESDEHIITIEDPIEYIHQRKKSLINQRSVGPHTASFSSALRSALREDPDIIMVGEMRDTETMGLALTAAETGHLVIGTLHTGSAAATISRVVNLFPASEQSQAVASLSESLVGIISQRLLVNAEGTAMVPAFEILVNSLAMANTIRDGDTHKIPSLIMTGMSQGMQSMETSLRALVAAKKITQAQMDEILAEES
ncbi:MAG TPA: PilT/PilU family type 4a pilus ATPase [bacterium]|nr:PilT/PilU family type 4a pilus ATPase [bacterium]